MIESRLFLFEALHPDLRPGILPPVPDDKGGIRVRHRDGA
jgi:hypothetical protein